MKKHKFTEMVCVALVIVVVIPGMLLGRKPISITSISSVPSTPPPKGSVHIKNHGSVSFNSYHIMTDGGGYRWDLQYYGNVYRGTPYAYSGGMYCHINGSNVRSGTRTGWRNKAGDEIEIGPANKNGLKIYRRVKVYKDRPLARWLDIFENPTAKPVTVNVRMYTCTNYTIRQTLTNTGQAKFGPKDMAFRTITSSSNGIPTLHVVTSKGAKIRPAVQTQSNTIYVNYNSLTIPAGKTIILCHFESQNRSADVHSKMMAKFPLRDVMKDLPMAVRSRIVNMKVSSSFGGVDLERLETGDNVLLGNDDPIVGEILNKSFHVSTVIGPMDLKCDNLVGMAIGANDTLKFAFIDGQVISGTAPGAKLEVSLGDNGVLHIPLEKTRQWSYRVSPTRPDEIQPLGASLTLVSGDHLAIDTSDDYPRFKFRWACGDIDLDTKQLQEIIPTSKGSSKFNAVFKNGTKISGSFIIETPPVEPPSPVVEPPEGQTPVAPVVPVAPQAPAIPAGLTLRLKAHGEINIQPNQIAAMSFAEPAAPDGTLTKVVLAGGDELLGEMTDEKFSLTTSFGQADVAVVQVKSIAFKTGSPDQTVLKMWNGSTMKGKINLDQLGFAVTPGGRWGLPLDKIKLITCPQALPPRALRLRVAKLIIQLGAENYKDRQTAAAALVAMGKGIVPLLKPALSNDDAEVRQRIEAILEQLGVKAPSASSPSSPRHIHQLNGQWQLEQGGQLIINGGGVVNLNGGVINVNNAPVNW
ncbi:MAG: HEAT repeat domain-containing protein [Phycisphaerales bacterium]|jgi:hypothetical protein|nr:HEAT repeat domain-containing protein [Phycisphaerales bacterium]